MVLPQTFLLDIFKKKSSIVSQILFQNVCLDYVLHNPLGVFLIMDVFIVLFFLFPTKDIDPR